jgi:hypothetical protein
MLVISLLSPPSHLFFFHFSQQQWAFQSKQFHTVYTSIVTYTSNLPPLLLPLKPFSHLLQSQTTRLNYPLSTLSLLPATFSLSLYITPSPFVISLESLCSPFCFPFFTFPSVKKRHQSNKRRIIYSFFCFTCFLSCDDHFISLSFA